MTVGVATGGSGIAQAAAKSCAFEFTWTKPGVYPPQIIARGVAQCEVPPEEHILTLALEYQNRGVWEVASAKEDRTLPPQAPNFASYQVSATCYAGTWRASMSVTGTIQGRPFVFSDHTQSREVPTSQCPSR